MRKNGQHYVRDCPKQNYQGCGEKDHYITKCGQMENAMMAIDMLGTKSTDDDSSVCSEADVEAYTNLEIKTAECLVSMMEEGVIWQMRDYLVTLRMILDYLRVMLSAARCYVVQEVTLSDRGDRYSSSFPSIWGGDGLCDVNKCCTCSRPFPSSSVTETYCRCEEIHRHPRGHLNSLCKIRR